MPSPCDLCSCAPANGSASGQTPYFFNNFLTRSVSFNLDGNAINALAGAAGSSAIFPLAVKVAEIDLQSNAGIIGMSLSTSIINPVAGAVCAVYLALENGLVTDVNGMQRQFVNHICGQNSVAGLPSANSRTNSIQMGQNSFYSVNSGQKIVLYASAPNDATALLAGVATVFWFGR